MPKFVLRSKSDDNVEIEFESDTVMDACVDAIYELGYTLGMSEHITPSTPAPPSSREFENAAKLLANAIWAEDCNHEYYDSHLETDGDPRDHVVYAAAVILGKTQLFDEDVLSHLEYEAELRAKFKPGDTVTINGYDVSGDKKFAWAIGKKATLVSILKFQDKDVGEVLIQDNGPETKLYPLSRLEPA